MSLRRNIGFRLAPIVHFYKKRLDTKEENTIVESVPTIEIPQSQQIPEILTLECLEPAGLTIKIPWASLIQEEGPIPPPYDASPPSPKSHREIRGQREQEEEERKVALEGAFNNFNQSITPTSQKTPVSPIKSSQ